MSRQEPRAELVNWIALRRAFTGGLARLHTSQGRYRYLCHGRPVPDWLLAPLDRLLAAGLLALAPPDEHAAQRAHLTRAGRLAYEALAAGQGSAADEGGDDATT